MKGIGDVDFDSTEMRRRMAKLPQYGARWVRFGHGQRTRNRTAWQAWANPPKKWAAQTFIPGRDQTNIRDVALGRQMRRAGLPVAET